MSALTESSSPKGGLCCELCDYFHFSTYTDWQVHHLHHLRQPVVRLVKLNQNLCLKLLQGKSYRLNTGVARSSQHNVPPLKISLVKLGDRRFTVKKEEVSNKLELFDSNFNSPKSEDPSSESDSRGSWVEIRPQTVLEGPSEVEGKDLLERLGASFSISRRGKASPQCADKKPDTGDEPSDSKKENILERLSGIGGISISAVSKSSNADSKPSSGISISSKAKSINLSQLKNLKEQAVENDKKFDQNKILEKLSGSGLISIAPKSGIKEEGKEWKEENKTKCEREEGSPRGESGLEKSGPASLKSNKSEDSNDSSDSKVSGDSRTSLVNANEESGKTTNGIEQKKFVRVKQSNFKKSMRPERQSSQEETSEEKGGTSGDDGREKGRNTGETGIDILERLTENLNNTVGAEKTTEAINPSESGSAATDPLAVDTDIRDLNTDMNDTESERIGEGGAASESQFQLSGEKNPQEQEQVQSLVLTPPSSSGQDGENSNYSTVSQNQQESFVPDPPDGLADGNNEANENAVSFASLSNDDQSEDHGEQQTAFWSDLQNSSNNVDQPQEDPLLTPENPVSNGDPNFLHNFSNDYQTPAGNIPHENSEFMSLDRLGQTQHQQSPFAGDQSSPMEHLNQQVQRIPNPTPQINVISQHHLQAPPPPPQLHTGVSKSLIQFQFQPAMSIAVVTDETSQVSVNVTQCYNPGVPLSPQHISPQQANSYDALHMQPPLPPPLYQGYMYNQSYPPQPQMPRAPQPQMPMLQQRPHIPSRNFQPMSLPQQRTRPRPTMKRSPIRPPQDMVSAAKQPRVNPPLQVRPQVPNTAAKLPSGITITPPKKTLEANKVANVLASRGITVTPSRQANQSVRSQQQQQQRSQSGSSTSGLNISSAVSITSSNQNRISGGFAVPGPRRSAPIVNHNAERPERCMTVDLTQDDEAPANQARNRAMGRFSCHLCGKVFSSPPALAAHKIHHRSSLPFKCELCSAEYSNMGHLANHRQTCHKKTPAPDLAIPIVDLNHPGARDQLRKCGVYNFIPLAQLQSNNNGYFGVPIIQLDTAKEKAVSNLSLLGAGNILVLGKMKAITPQQSH